MTSLVALILLGQILGCSFSHAFQIYFDCNGEYAEKLAGLAVQYINEHSLHGYKYALNIIKGIHVQTGTYGDLFFLELNLLETVCHVSDPTPVENCTVRPQHQHAVEGHCYFKILSKAVADKVLAAKCHSSPDSVENVRRNCTTCPILLPLNDPRVVQSVEYVLHHHNEQNPNNAYQVLEISRGQHNYDPERFYLEFLIVETNCSHHEVHNDHYHCHVKEGAVTGFCRATVFIPHAALEKHKDVHYESDCVMFQGKEGHSHAHLIEHHIEKNIASPGHNNTVLDLIHSHNHTAPNLPDDHHKFTSIFCAGKVHHFKV